MTPEVGETAEDVRKRHVLYVAGLQSMSFVVVVIC